MTSTLESPTFTLLLVSDFTGAVGDDLDAGNDGVLDAAPWTAIADAVAFSDGAAGARTYEAPVLGPNFDGTATSPGGASRFPYYRDTDLDGDWKRNDFDGSGLPGMTGTLAAGEARNTPESVTRVALSDFYAAVDATSPSALRSTLHAALETHIRFPYTADTTDVWDILNTADQDPVDFGKILDIYKNAVYTKISGGTGPTTASTPGRTPTVSTTIRRRSNTRTATTSSRRTRRTTRIAETSRTAPAPTVAPPPRRTRTRPCRITPSAAGPGPIPATRTGTTASSTRSGITGAATSPGRSSTWTSGMPGELTLTPVPQKQT
ncbi:MAG: hypothetical protein IPP07_28550 [Holophagales bacterium]|nr:hypothetical protein [Holophagales bacterium]